MAEENNTNILCCGGGGLLGFALTLGMGITSLIYAYKENRTEEEVDLILKIIGGVHLTSASIIFCSGCCAVGLIGCGVGAILLAEEDS